MPGRLPRAPRNAASLTIVAATLLASIVSVGCTPGGTRAEDSSAVGAELSAAIASRRIPRIVIDGVTPPSLVTDGDSAQVSLIAEHKGNQIAKFPYADIYFKVLFGTIDELRVLGVDARANEELLFARHRAYQAETTDNSVGEVDHQLSRLGAGDDVPGVMSLTLGQKKSVLASRRLLLASRSGLAFSKQPEAPSGRAIHELYFAPGTGGGMAPTRLHIDIGDASVRTYGVDLPDFGETGHQSASVELGFLLRDPTGAVLARYSTTESVEREGSGVVPKHTSYSLAIKGEPPLEVAIRRAARGLARELIDTYPLR